VIDCQLCNQKIARMNLGRGYFVPRSTQPSIPPGSVNEYQLQLGRQRQVWLIPIADERVGVQVRSKGQTVRKWEHLVCSLLSGFLVLFLSHTGEEAQVTSVYGRPLPAVMKLMRVIATAGRHMAAMLVCWMRVCHTVQLFSWTFFVLLCSFCFLFCSKDLEEDDVAKRLKVTLWSIARS